jgi:hypothetical protein
VAAPVDPGTAVKGAVVGADAAASRALGSAQAGRSRNGTRIMPHGVTALPDPGRATEPIDEPPPSWRRRSRRPFFALPSLLLLVLVVCLGMSELGASGGAAAGPVPNIEPATPGHVAAPPSATPSATPSVTPTDGQAVAGDGARRGHGIGKGGAHGKAAGNRGGQGKSDGKPSTIRS